MSGPDDGRRRMLLTGAGGQLGRVIAQAWADRVDLTALGRADLDITNDDAVARTVESVRPDLVVNCAAYNDVDGAEDAAVEALDTNAFGVDALARATAAVDGVLVHYSTDFVFDGLASSPYTEDARPGPGSVYAASKLLGEWFAAACPRHYVLRVESLFGGPAARSSVDRIKERLQAGGEARVFHDRTVSPSYVEDVAQATWALVERAAPPGVYHCVNAGATTWLELGRELNRLLGGRGTLVPVSVDEVPLRARRPRYAALANAKLERLGVRMPTWQDALARYIMQNGEAAGPA